MGFFGTMKTEKCCLALLVFTGTKHLTVDDAILF